MNDIEKYIYANCQDPQKVCIYNGVKGIYEYKDVPCGKCYHCKITKINEWVSRMVIQSMYSKYVYFGTLTYNGKRESILNDECLSIITNFNKTNTFNSTPLILRKDHLQKFFKRLRKNTGIKFQYAACGEYGSTYSRPHFHYIIWSDKPISKIQVYKAWSAPAKHDLTKKVVIGKIEHRDIKNNAYLTKEDPDNTHVYKYVCKYIQKFDFKFNKLTNYYEHEKNFRKNFDSFPYLGEVQYTSKRLDDYLKAKKVQTMCDYEKTFSPFFHCSKKPAIAYQYFADYCDRFQNGDFRLFGVSKEYIFPLYFIRKTKEQLCPLKARSEKNSGVTSYSRMPKMATLLSHIETAQQIAEDSNQIIRLFRSISDDNPDATRQEYTYSLETNEQIQDLTAIYDDKRKQTTYLIKREYLGFVDIEKHIEYSFRGDYFAMYNTTTGRYIGESTIENTKNIITYYYEQLKKKILLSMDTKSTLSANKKAALIEAHGGIEKFEELRKHCIKNFNAQRKVKQELYKQSKTFE